jgi:hypothetical protein
MDLFICACVSVLGGDSYTIFFCTKKPLTQKPVGPETIRLVWSIYKESKGFAGGKVGDVRVYLGEEVVTSLARA